MPVPPLDCFSFFFQVLVYLFSGTLMAAPPDIYLESGFVTGQTNVPLMQDSTVRCERTLAAGKVHFAWTRFDPAPQKKDSERYPSDIGTSAFQAISQVQGDLFVFPMDRRPVDCLNRKTEDLPLGFLPDREFYGGFRFCKKGRCDFRLGWSTSARTNGFFSPLLQDSESRSGVHFSGIHSTAGEIYFTPLYFPGLTLPGKDLSVTETGVSLESMLIASRKWSSRLKKSQLSGSSTGHALGWYRETEHFLGHLDLSLRRLRGNRGKSSLVATLRARMAARTGFLKVWDAGILFQWTHTRGRFPADSPSFDGRGRRIQGNGIQIKATSGNPFFRITASVYLTEPARKTENMALNKNETEGFFRESPLLSPGGLLMNWYDFQPAPVLTTVSFESENLSKNPEPFTRHNGFASLGVEFHRNGWTIASTINLLRPLARESSGGGVPFRRTRVDRDRPSFFEMEFLLRKDTGAFLIDIRYNRLHGMGKETPREGRFQGESVSLGTTWRMRP